MEKNENYSVLFQVHLIFTFFLFLLLPHIANHFEPNLSESALLALALFNTLIGIALCISEGRIMMPFKPALLFLYAFFLFVIAHYFLGNKSEEGRQFLNGSVLVMMFVFNLSQACRTKKIVLLLAIGVVINGALQIIIGFNQHFYSLPEMEALIQKNPQMINEYSRGFSNERFMERIIGKLSFGSFIYPNTLGAYLGFFLFALVGLYLHLKERVLPVMLKFILFIFIITALLCIYFTGAKGVWISLFVILVLGSVIFIFQRKYKELSLKFYIITGGCLLFCLIAAPFVFKNVLSMKVRLNYWQAALQMFLNESAQWIGLGAGGFTNYYLKYKLPFGEEVQKAHNYFVTLLVEQGILGLSLFLLFLGSLFYCFLKDKKNQNNPNEEVDFDRAMPNTVYMLLFYLIFSIFMAINPQFTNITLGLSVLTLYTLIILFLIIAFRFLINKKIFQPLPFENKLTFQILVLSGCSVIFFTDLVNAYIEIEDWPNFIELNNIFPALAILLLILLFFTFTIYGHKKVNIERNDSKSAFKIFGILLIVYHILMIGGDMVGEYSSFVITFFALTLVFEKLAFENSSEVKLPNMISVFAFVILSYGLSFFIFEKIVMPDIGIARFRYLYEHWDFKGSTKKEGLMETKESILEEGQKKFPDHMYFPLEKAKLYHFISKKYQGSGLKRNIVQWNSRAIEELDKCIKLSPLKANLYDYKADLMEEMGEIGTKIEDVRLLALERYPTKAIYHYKLGVFYKNMGNIERALKYFKSAIFLQKNSNRYTVLNKEEFDEAIRYTVENDSKADYNSTKE